MKLRIPSATAIVLLGTTAPAYASYKDGALGFFLSFFFVFIWFVVLMVGALLRNTESFDLAVFRVIAVAIALVPFFVVFRGQDFTSLVLVSATQCVSLFIVFWASRNWGAAAQPVKTKMDQNAGSASSEVKRPGSD